MAIIRVQLIEDNLADARLIQEELAGQIDPAFEFIYADRLARGIQLALSQTVDLILLDLNLPDSTGMETLIRMLSACPSIPVVILTGVDDERLGLEAMRHGAQDYLVKGQLGGKGLSRAIRFAIERKRAEEALKRGAEIQTVLREIAEAAVVSIDLAEFYKAVHGLINRIFPLIGFYIALLDKNAAQIMVPYSAFARNSIPAQRPLNKGLTEYVLEQKRCIYLTEDELERLFASGQVENLLGDKVTLFLGAPLYDSQREIFGVLVLFSTDKQVQIRQSDCEVLSIISSQVSLAIEGKRAATQLRQSEERFRSIVENVNDLIFCLTPEGLISYTSDNWSQILNEERDELLGRFYADFVHTDSHAASNEFIHRLLVSGEKQGGFECRIKHKNSGWSWHVINAAPVFNADGSVASIIGFSRDISGFKQIERFQNLSHQILCILNEDNTLGDAIRQIIELIKGETQFDAVGIRLRSGEDFPYFFQNGFSADFVVQENSLFVRDESGGICRDETGYPSLECTCGLVLCGRTDPSNPLFTAGGSAWTNDSFPLLEIPAELDPRIKPRNNCIHAGYSSIALIPILADREIVGLLQMNDRNKNRLTLEIVRMLEMICANIGSALLRKKAEAALKSSQERYKALMDQSFEALALVDIEKQEVVEVNRRFTELFGYSLPEDAPLLISKYMTEAPDEIDKLYGTGLAQRRVLPPESKMYRSKNGTAVYGERAGTVINIDGRDYLLGSMRDITDERRRQQEMVKDVEFARRVQQALLPQLVESPSVSVRTLFYPSHFVSGDFYHLEWQNEGSLLRGFLVDVSGHGLGTALQTASINVLLREAVRAHLSLPEQMQWLNLRAEKYFKDGAYAAMLGFELDLSVGELRYVAAGITQFHINGTLVKTPGMFVGVWENAEFSSGIFPVSIGDSFFFLTDGFSDVLARPEYQGFWSPDGKDFAADVEALERIAMNEGLRDDASGICLRINNTIALD